MLFGLDLTDERTFGMLWLGGVMFFAIFAVVAADRLGKS